MNKSPCKGCHDRYIGCHGSCPKYQQYKKSLENERQARPSYNNQYFKQGGNSRPSKQIRAYRKGVI